MRVVGIAGPSGAGKSALAEDLARSLRGANRLLLDWYYKDPEDLPSDGNFCDPKYLRVESFLHDLRALSGGATVQIPAMDMSTFRRTGGVVVIQPTDWLIVEGMTLYRFPDVYDLCDVRIYLSPGLPAIRRRKFSRDRRERGRSAEHIKTQLAWVEAEYLNDLRAMPPGVHVIQGLRQSQVTREAMACIACSAPS